MSESAPKVVNAQFLPEVIAYYDALLPLPPPEDPLRLKYGQFHWGCTNWTPDLLVAAAKAADRVESPLSLARFQQITGIPRSLVARLFEGGWTELLDRAEIEGRRRAKRDWDEESLLEAYDAVVCRLGRHPTQIEFEAYAETTRQTLRYHIGPKAAVVERYHAWLKEHGLEFPTRPEGPSPSRYPGEEVVKGTWTRERLIAAARTADRASPDPLSLPRFCELAEVSNYTVYRLFPAGWSDLVRTAGIRENRRAHRYTDDDLLHLYHELKARLGHHPTANQLRRLLPVSNTTYRNRFGNMGELRERYEAWLDQE